MSNLLWLAIPGIFLVLQRAKAEPKPQTGAPPANIPGGAPPADYGKSNAVPSKWTDLTDSPFLLSLPGDATGGTNDPRDMAILNEIHKRATLGVLGFGPPPSPAQPLSGAGWSDVYVSAGGLAARVPVQTDAVKLDGVRVNTSFELQQRTADLLGLFSLTDKVGDAIDQQGLKIDPSTHGGIGDWMAKGQGSWTRHMLEHSYEVDDRIENAGHVPGDVLINNPGKYWINTYRNWELASPTTGAKYLDGPHGANFGWYKPGGGKWQNIGNAHNIWHADYSQVMRFMGPWIFLIQGDGSEIPVPTATALKDPELAPLLMHMGKPLLAARHPAIPEWEQKAVLIG